MWFRRTSDQLLNEPRRLSTADYLCKLMEEQNSLLREVVSALTHQQANTRRAILTNVSRIRTDADVIRVGRTGPVSAPTASTSGHTPNVQVSDPEASPPRPSAP